MTCVLDTVRFFDEERYEWGYAVACVGEHDCGHWRELFRLPPIDGSALCVICGHSQRSHGDACCVCSWCTRYEPSPREGSRP